MNFTFICADWLHLVLPSTMPQADDVVLRTCILWPPSRQMPSETNGTGKGEQVSMALSLSLSLSLSLFLSLSHSLSLSHTHTLSLSNTYASVCGSLPLVKHVCADGQGRRHQQSALQGQLNSLRWWLEYYYTCNC